VYIDTKKTSDIWAPEAAQVRRKPPSAAAFGFNRIIEAHNKHNVAQASFGT
jgi:hypothetical protein